MRLRCYYHPNTYDSQIEGSAICNLRIGYTALGVALFRLDKLPRWIKKRFPIFSITLNTHSGQNDMIWVFKVILFGVKLRKLKGGPLTDYSLHSAQSIGTKLYW